MKSLVFWRVTRGFVVLFTFFCFHISLVSFTFAADINLAWDKPQGSVKGYRIYYGKVGTDFKLKPQVVIDDPDQTSCLISGLEPGAVYGFSTTSIDNKGVESSFSEELYYNVPLNGEDMLDDTWTETDQIGNETGAPGNGSEGANGSAGSITAYSLKDGYLAIQMFHNGGFGTALMKATFDGAGNIAGEDISRSPGSGTGMGKTYATDGVGGLTIEGADKGAVSSDGNYFVAGRMNGDSPAMVFGIRKAEGVAISALNGTYKMFMFASTPDPQTGIPVLAPAAETLQADGQGNFTGGFSAACSIDAGTGQLVINPAATYGKMNGVVSADGSIFAMADTDPSDGTLLFAIGMKEAADPQASALAGSYYVNTFEYADPAAAAAPLGAFGKISVGNDGAYTLSLLAKSCDCPTGFKSGKVSPGGNAELQSVDASTQETAGAVSPNGEVFAMVQGQSFGIGIEPASAATAPAATSGGGGGGGGGGCFISSLLN